MGLSPAWFPISSQRIGGEPERPDRRVAQTLLFWYNDTKDFII